MYRQRSYALLFAAIACLTDHAKPEVAATLQDLFSSYISNVQAFNPDIDLCAGALFEADENADGVIQEHEYPRLIHDLSSGKIKNTNYEDLPLPNRLNFIYLSRLCGEDNKNCQGNANGIRTIGAELQRVCMYTEMTVNYVVESTIQQLSLTDPPLSMTSKTVPPSSAPSVDARTAISSTEEMSTAYKNHSSIILLQPTTDLHPDVVAYASPDEHLSSIELDDPITLPMNPTPNPSVAPMTLSMRPTLTSEVLSSNPPTIIQGAPVNVWNEQYLSRTNQKNDESSLPSSATIAVVAAAVAMVVATWFAGLFVLRRRDNRNVKNLNAHSCYREHKLKADQLDENQYDDEIELGEAQGLPVQIPGAESSPKLASLSRDDSDTSGWSSSAGLSSLRTATFDSLADDELPQVSSAIVNLKEVSAMKEVVKRVITPASQSSGALDSHQSQESNGRGALKDDLIAAIQAGDWTLVGSTAALLASSERSVASDYQCSIVTDATDFSLDNSLASDFSKLVDCNDWEGVMRAADMLEGASDSESTVLEQFSSLELQKKAELQALAVELVQDVIPDELDHIDEMLAQFRNREEELIQTLQMMRDRNDERKHALRVNLEME